MRYEHLLIESREAADWVTLNRPEQLNTLNPQLLRELNDYFAGLERNYAVRVVVLRGAGRAFCTEKFAPQTTMTASPTTRACSSRSCPSG